MGYREHNKRELELHGPLPQLPAQTEGLRILARIISRHLERNRHQTKVNVVDDNNDGIRMKETKNFSESRRSVMTNKKIQTGRPRISVDFAIVLRLRDVDNLGWSRMAGAYREITGQYISRDTIKRRYLEAIALQDSTEN